MDQKDKKLTLTGDIDPVAVVAKLRKICYAEIVSVGPAKEPEKKKEEPKKEDAKKEDEKKKEDPKKDGAKVDPAHFLKGYPAYYQPYQAQPQPYYYQHQYQQHPAALHAPLPYFNRGVEEDPNGCVIC